MQEIILDQIKEKYENNRIDKILSEILEIPRNQIQKYIKDGLVTVCDKNVAKSYKLQRNDRIKIVIPPPKEFKLKPIDAPIEIIFEDEDIIVINKPPKLVVHPGAALEEMSVVSALLFRGVKLSNIGAPLRPGVVHRIDKDTSGVLVLAKNDRSHFELARQFFEHSIERIYIGIVACHLKQGEGTVEKPIGRHPRNRKLFTVSKNGKEAKTQYRVLKKLENYDVVMFKLFTGRTHQIRVHMKSIGCPLLGDVFYGSKSKAIGRQALHAFKLVFKHPTTGDNMKFFSKLPYDMKEIMNGG